MRRSFGPGLVVCALVFLFVLVPSAGAATFVVNTTADSTPDGCTTAANGCTLREAIEDANAAAGDDVVTLPSGYYKLAADDLGPLVVDQGSPVTLNGAGASTTTIDADAFSSVFEVEEEATLDATGITITGGYPCDCGIGAGVFGLPSSTVILNDSVVTKNTGVFGGGVSSINGDVVLNRTEVDHNIGFAGGGGVAVDSGTLTVEDSFIHANHTAGVGGGIASVVSVGCPPSECPPGDDLALAPGSDSVSPEDAGTLSVENTTVSDNTASGDGGGIFYVGDTGSISSLARKGDPGFPPTPAGELVNTTVSGNVSFGGYGGGVNVYDGSFDFLNSTITDNQTVDPDEGDGGGGVFAGGFPQGGSEVTFKNTIVAENRNESFLQNCEAYDHDVFLDDEGNLSDDDTCDFGEASSGIDPKLGPLADNGGPAPTHALRDGSPAIDAGVNDGAPQLDERGGDRPPADGSAGDTVDIGAYEAYSLADLAVEAKADGPDPQNVGGRITYTVVVRNNGPDRVNGVSLADALPAGVTPAGVGGVTGGGSCSTAFVCEWQQLGSGQVATATFNTTATTTGTHTNSATIGALGITDPDHANNTNTAATTVIPAGALPPSTTPSGDRELDDSIAVSLEAPKTVSLDTFFSGISVTTSCTDELCLRKLREHAAINTGATHIAGFNLTVSRTSLGFNTKKTVKLRPCLSGSTTGRRHRQCMRNLRKAAKKAAPFRVKVVVEAVDKAGNRDWKKAFITVKP